jgi:predicted nucleic acid-binding protein
MTDEEVVVDASALLDLMISSRAGPALSARTEGCSLHAPGHVDAEVLASLGHLEQSGLLSSDAVFCYAETMAPAPIERHPVAGLMAGAWWRRDHLPLSVALYVELARTLGATLVTSDPELARATQLAELVGRVGSGAR